MTCLATGWLSAQPLRFHYAKAPSLDLPFRMSGFDMKQDQTGMIYWCSVDGVYAFDGFRVRLFQLDNNRFRSPQPQYVTSLHIDRQNVVWAGLRNGLARLDRFAGQLVPVCTSPTKTTDSAFRLFEDKEGYIWSDTYDGDLRHGNATRFHLPTGRVAPVHIRLTDGSPLQEPIEYICQDALGLRLLTAKGSFQLRKVTRDSFIATPLVWPGGPKNGHLYHLLATDSLGYCWAIDTAGYLYSGNDLHHLQRFRAIPEAAGWKNPRVYCDRKNRAWIAGPEIAVYDASHGRYQIIPAKTGDREGFSGDYVHHIFHDRRNIHWIMSGSRNTGGDIQLWTEQPATFGIWQPTDVPCNVFAVYRESDSGELWIGTLEQGVYHLDSLFRTLHHFKASPDAREGLLTDKVIFIAPAGNDAIWFNCVPAGISIWNKTKGRLTPMAAPDRRSYQECFRLKNGQLLLAAYNESALFNPSTGLFQPLPAISPGSIGLTAFRFIQDIFEDGPYIWMGGYDKRIHRLHLDRGELFTADTSFLEHNVMSLHRRGDSLYVGTLGGGLAIYDIPRDKFVGNYMAKEGLPHHAIMGILEDSKHRLWLFSSNGLTMFEPEQRRFTDYGKLEGLPWEGFSSGSCFQDDRGIMYGGGAGLLWFHPDSLSVSRPDYKATVHLTGFWLAGKNMLPYTRNNTLDLRPDENYFKVEFSHFDYGYPRIDSFWYRLEGYHDAWYNTAAAEAVFSRIPPGRYIFRVRAANRFGVGSDQEAVIHIRIRPWWWQSLWFRALLLLTAVSVAAYAWRQFVRRKEAASRDLRIQIQLKSLEALRSQLNYHFVKNALGRANAKVLSNDIEDANQFLGQFSVLMRLVLQGTRSDFYLLRDEAMIMRLYLDIQRKRWREMFETEFFIDPSLESGDYYCPSLLIQPLAENAIEHGLLPKPVPPRLLTIRWERTDTGIRCLVEDTGIGLQPLSESPAADTSHIGLENARSRIRIINELYRIDIRFSTGEIPEGGLRITVEMPLLSRPPYIKPIS